MTPAEILRKAADLIEPEGAWCQGAFAKTDQGKATYSANELAVCWCAGGALLRVTRNASDTDHNLACAAAEQIMHGDISEWNDAPGRTQAEVVTALRQAATTLEQEGEL